MLVATAMVLHRILTYNSDSAYRRNVFIALMGTLVPFSIYHYVTNELVGHVAVFAGMILYIGYKTRELIARRIKTREARRRVRKLERTGACKSLFLLSASFCIRRPLCQYPACQPHRFLVQAYVNSW